MSGHQLQASGRGSMYNSRGQHRPSRRLPFAELRVQQCNNFFASGTETLDAVTCCATRLKKLHLLEMRCHASNHALACLGALTQVLPPPQPFKHCTCWPDT